MSGNARIGSVQKLQEFRSRLIIARDSIRVALNEATTDIQRIKMWISQEQKSYWQGIYRKRQEQYQLARRQLNSKKNETSMLGNRRSCIDEEKAFQKAKFLLEEAEQKLKNIQRWSGVIDKEIYSYRGVVQPITTIAEDDMAKAAALLESMVISLEMYADNISGSPESVLRSGQIEEQDQQSDNQNNDGADNER